MFGLAMGDLDGDGLDDVVFADSEAGRLRIFLQRPDGSFAEADEKQEPAIGSIGQCIRLADLDGDGRLDVVVSKTYGVVAARESAADGRSSSTRSNSLKRRRLRRIHDCPAYFLRFPLDSHRPAGGIFP